MSPSDAISVQQLATSLAVMSALLMWSPTTRFIWHTTMHFIWHCQQQLKHSSCLIKLPLMAPTLLATTVFNVNWVKPPLFFSSFNWSSLLFFHCAGIEPLGSVAHVVYGPDIILLPMQQFQSTGNNLILSSDSWQKGHFSLHNGSLMLIPCSIK